MVALSWLNALWGSRYLEIYVAIASMAVALWMGLYLLRRGAGTPTGLLGGSAILLLALLYALEAMRDAPGISAHEHELLLRTRGVVIPTPVTIWIALSFLLKNKRRIDTAVRRVWLIVGVVGASQIWLQAFTNWHYDYAHIYLSPFPWQDWSAPVGPGFATFAALILSGLLWSMYNILRPFYDEAGSLRAVVRVAQFWPLFTGMCLLIISITYLVAVFALGIGAPNVIGLGGMTLGIVAFGFAVFWHNTFVEEGRDVNTDFLYSLVGTGAVLALYIAIIYLADGFHHLGVGLSVVIVAALVITHSLHDVAYRLCDRLLDRLGISCWTTRQRLRRQMLLRAQHEEESRDALRKRLAVLLAQLCQEISTNRGYVAMRIGHDFIVQATCGILPQAPTVVSPKFVCESITTIPYDCQVDGLKGMGVIIPLSTRGRQVGVIVLGEKRYDDGEINRMIVHAEAMQLEIEALEVAEEIRRLQRRLARLQRQEQPSTASEDDKRLLSTCAKSGLGFRNAVEAIAAATDMLENYREDPYALETSPFLRCSKVQSVDASDPDRSQVVAILEVEIAATIARMKPLHTQGHEWRRWTYLDRRYIHRYDENDRRFTMEDIARLTGVSRKTLTRGHEKAVHDFVLALMAPDLPSSAS